MSLGGRFLAAENLPATYREQVVQFILQNAQAATANPVSTPNVDPFTGGAAYTPGSSSQRPSAPSANADPFTGAPSQGWAAVALIYACGALASYPASGHVT